MNAKEWKQAHLKAIEYVGKIGAGEPHLKSFGRLSKLTVASEVSHQGSPSATNYWGDKNFDEALAVVIRNNFRSLAQQAIDYMGKNYATTKIAEKQFLLDQLAEIESLENTQLESK